MIDFSRFFALNHNSIVYIIKNKVNSMVYIGQSKGTPQKRWNLHKKLLERNNHFNTALQVDWCRYGADSFEFSVLEYIDDQYVNECESIWIETYAGNDCYNNKHNHAGMKNKENALQSDEWNKIMVKKKIRKCLLDYGKYRGVDDSEKVMSFIASQLGERPANETVATVLKELGYKPLASYWVKA
jgi:group I intron endonuclease